MAEDVTQLRLRIHAVQPADPDQRVQYRRTLTTAVRAGEQPVFSAQGDSAQGVLCDVVVDFRIPITAVLGMRIPLFQQVSRPAAPNDTPEGRALNCRVEISLVAGYSTSLGTQSPAFIRR